MLEGGGKEILVKKKTVEGLSCEGSWRDCRGGEVTKAKLK